MFFLYDTLNLFPSSLVLSLAQTLTLLCYWPLKHINNILVSQHGFDKNNWRSNQNQNSLENSRYHMPHVWKFLNGMISGSSDHKSEQCTGWHLVWDCISCTIRVFGNMWNMNNTCLKIIIRHIQVWRKAEDWFLIYQWIQGTISVNTRNHIDLKSMECNLLCVLRNKKVSGTKSSSQSGQQMLHAMPTLHINTIIFWSKLCNLKCWQSKLCCPLLAKQLCNQSNLCNVGESNSLPS